MIEQAQLLLIDNIKYIINNKFNIEIDMIEISADNKSGSLYVCIGYKLPDPRFDISILPCRVRSHFEIPYINKLLAMTYNFNKRNIALNENCSNKFCCGVDGYDNERGARADPTHIEFQADSFIGADIIIPTKISCNKCSSISHQNSVISLRLFGDAFIEEMRNIEMEYVAVKFSLYKY